MKKIIFTIFTILIFSQVYSQTLDTIIPRLTDTEFGKLKLEYIKMSKSSLFKKRQSLHKEYFNKVPFVVYLNDETEEKFTKSIAANLSKSKFKTIEEAVGLRREYYKTNKKLEGKYREVFKLMNRATQEEKTVITNLN